MKGRRLLRSLLIAGVGFLVVLGLIKIGRDTDEDNIIPPLKDWPTTSVPGEGLFP